MNSFYAGQTMGVIATLIFIGCFCWMGDYEGHKACKDLTHKNCELKWVTK